MEPSTRTLPDKGRAGTAVGELSPALVPYRGAELLAHPLLNKDTAFTESERDQFGLHGLLPCRVSSIEEQVALEVEHIRRKSDDVERYIGLCALQDRNETLFYRVLVEHLEELLPIVYTPTVGRACQLYSHIMRRPRGIWITPPDLGSLPQLLGSIDRDVRLIVVTDNERILGLGDQGAGGMGIPVGKLALYTAGAGIRPALGLPVSLDVGTDNRALLEDPLYLGYRRPRLRGQEYDEFVDAFVDAVLHVFPRALLQWEDFKQHNAIRLLARYRHRITSFNDDIQGTAAVVLAGILAALRLTGEAFTDQRVLLMGAGAAGLGIASLLRRAMEARNTHGNPARGSIVMMDSKGLVFASRDQVDEDKRAFALDREEMSRYGFPPARHYDLATVVRHVQPNVLVGTTGTASSFTEEALRLMAQSVRTPIVLPLSNPTANTEAVPADILAWTDGRALVATGSPFEPVPVGGRTHLIRQANNAFVFPGVGLGVMVAESPEVTDDMFLAAAETLGGTVPKDELARGALYPSAASLRDVSREIAVSVVREAGESSPERTLSDEQIEAAVDSHVWFPEYVPYEHLDPVRAPAPGSRGTV